MVIVVMMDRLPADCRFITLICLARATDSSGECMKFALDAMPFRMSVGS